MRTAEWTHLPSVREHEEISFMPSVNCGTQNRESSVKARRHAIGLCVLLMYPVTVPEHANVQGKVNGFLVNDMTVTFSSY